MYKNVRLEHRKLGYCKIGGHVRDIGTSSMFPICCSSIPLIFSSTNNLKADIFCYQSCGNF